MSKESNKGTPFYLGKPFIFIFAIMAALGVVAGGVSLGAVQNLYDDPDMETIISLYLQNPKNQKFIMAQIMQTESWKAHVRNNIDFHGAITDAVKLHEDGSSANFTAIGKQLSSHNNKLTVLTAIQGNQGGTATPQGSADFNLKLLSITGNIVIDSEFGQNEVVFVSGVYTGAASKFDISFKRGGSTIQSNTGLGMPSDGVFTYAFNTLGDAELGTYVATVSINGKTDTVSFEIK